MPWPTSSPTASTASTMQSPPLELVLDVGHITARNLLRCTGEADEDTISEITRGIVDRLGPAGPLLFTGVLYVGAEVFRRHILKDRTLLVATIRTLDALRR